MHTCLRCTDEIAETHPDMNIEVAALTVSKKSINIKINTNKSYYTCESDAIILMAPMSCNMSSAAIVSALIRDSANETSFLIFLFM